MKVIIAPLEAQIREHKDQLRHRQQSVQRILVAIDSLEDKIETIEQLKAGVDEQRKSLTVIEDTLKTAISDRPPMGVAA